MKVILKSKKGSHYAIGDFDGETLIVKKGSKINPNTSFDSLPAKVVGFRKDCNIFDDEFNLLIDVTFDNPTSAAQFVTGRSVNGYIAWRIDDKISLKEYRKR